jgi:hypothetical protein
MSATLPNGTANGRPQQRKQLSDQLDRFDEILDGLANGLNEAMADAAREGTRQAVKDAIVEILTNPDLRAAIQGIGSVPVTSEPAPTPAPISAWARVKDLCRKARAALASAVRTARSFVVRKVSAATKLAVGAGKVSVAAWRVKRAVLATSIAGVAVGIGAYYASPHVGAVLCAGAGAFVAVAVRTAVWIRSALRPFLPA